MVAKFPSVNNVAPMYAANFAELDGQNIGGALVSITAAPSTPAGSNPGDNDVAFELHLVAPLNMWRLAVSWSTSIISACNTLVATMAATVERAGTMEAPVVITEHRRGDRTQPMDPDAVAFTPTQSGSAMTSRSRCLSW